MTGGRWCKKGQAHCICFHQHVGSAGASCSSRKLRMSFESHAVRRRQQGWTLALLALFWARSESAGLAPGTRLPGLPFRLANREDQSSKRTNRPSTARGFKIGTLHYWRPGRYFRSCLRQRNKPSVYTANAQAAGISSELRHICHLIPSEL